MVTLQECLTKLADFKQEHGEQFGITRIGVFGSVARQENTDDSDIDILVENSHPTLSLMYKLRQELTTLLGRKVDLVRMHDSLRPVFKSKIQNEASTFERHFHHHKKSFLKSVIEHILNCND